MSNELLLLGFASLILAAFSNKITSICGAIMHPKPWAAVMSAALYTVCVCAPAVRNVHAWHPQVGQSLESLLPGARPLVLNCVTAYKQ